MSASLVNDTRFVDLMKEVRELGREAAAGADALPNLAMRVALAARDGIISTEKDTEGKDDADRIYTEYRHAQSKKAVHEHTEGGVAGNTSKLRAILTAGMLPDIDFPNEIERVIAERKVLKEKKEKVKGAYEAFVVLARRQLEPANMTEPLTDEVISDIARKVSKTKTPAERLAEVYKALSDLNDEKELEAAREYIQAAAENVRDAILSVDGTVPAVTKEEKELAALMAKAAAKGYVLSVTPMAEAAE